MRRRGFLAGLFPCIAAFFGAGATQAREDIDAKPNDATGKPLARLYRRDANGEFHEISHWDVKPGDECISIGVTNGNLWRVRLYRATAGSDGKAVWKFDDGGVGIVPEEYRDITADFSAVLDVGAIEGKK